MKKRITSLLIALMLLIALIPTKAFAEDAQGPETADDAVITSAEPEQPSNAGSDALQAPAADVAAQSPNLPKPEITIETYCGGTKIDYEGGTVSYYRAGNYWILSQNTKSGFDFGGFYGDCHKKLGVYYVEVAEGKKVTAKFVCCNEAFRKLKINIDGEGSVSTDPGALFTIGDDRYYLFNTWVKLTGTAAHGWCFKKFTGNINPNNKVLLCSDKSVTAHFEKCTYNVVFNPGLHGMLNGQTNPVTVPTLFGEKPEEPAVTPFDGYGFAGWSPDIVPADEALEYTALYDCIPYNIDYDYDGGSADNPDTYTVESGEITLRNPVRTGYLFAGWSGTGIEDGTMEVVIPAGSTGNREYKALWTPVTYFVTYNKNGGSGGMTANSTHVYDVESKLTKNGYDKQGHDFIGWSASPDAAAADYTDEMSVINLSSTNGDVVELFAVWKLKKFDVSFYQQDGTTQIGATQTVNWNAAAALETAPAVTGYTFDKWVLTGDDDTETTSLTSVKENIKAVAAYVKNKYTVTFVDEQNKVIATQTVAYGDAATAPAPPAKSGYTFAGWDKPYSLITGDLTVTALYKRIESSGESVPDTGDAGSQPFPWLWIGIAALLIGAIAAIAAVQSKRGKKTGGAV